MRAVMHCNEEVEPVLDHAGADGGEALLEGHGALQIPSGPPASPRSVSANSESSGGMRLIMPCWKV